MNGFKTVNQNIRNLELKLEEQTDGLTEIMRQIEHNNIMKTIHNANNYYDSYVRLKGAAHYAEYLGDNLWSVEVNIIGLKLSIGGLFDSYMKSYGDFDQLFDFMTYISTIITKTKLAIAVGCIDDCGSDTFCKNNCDNRTR